MMSSKTFDTNDSTSDNSVRVNFLISVGTRIRDLRKERNWSQERLAQEARINDKYVYEIELGHRSISIWVLVKIAEALNVCVTEILGSQRNHE